MKQKMQISPCAMGAVVNAAREQAGCTVTQFCREAGISVKSYYRLMHKKRQPRSLMPGCCNCCNGYSLQMSMPRCAARMCRPS